MKQYYIHEELNRYKERYSGLSLVFLGFFSTFPFDFRIEAPTIKIPMYIVVKS
jgi:hypothetical protein